METVSVTGASRGIGLALVARYLAAGSHVVATCRSPDPEMDLKSLQERDAKLEILPFETTSEAQGIIVCPVHPGWVQTDMGGAQADITPAQSADGLFQLISQLDASKSGRFWSFDGSEHPW